MSWHHLEAEALADPEEVKLLTTVWGAKFKRRIKSSSWTLQELQKLEVSLVTPVGYLGGANPSSVLGSASPSSSSVEFTSVEAMLPAGRHAESTQLIQTEMEPQIQDKLHTEDGL